MANFYNAPVRLFNNQRIGEVSLLDTKICTVTNEDAEYGNQQSRGDYYQFKDNNQSRECMPETVDQLKDYFDLTNAKLSPSEKQQLLELLFFYKDVFSFSEFDLGHTTVMQHKINTGDAQPLAQRPYRNAMVHRSFIEEQLMLDKGLINVSISMGISNRCSSQERR